jgi:hypothetical protein
LSLAVYLNHVHIVVGYYRNTVVGFAGSLISDQVSFLFSVVVEVQPVSYRIIFPSRLN